MAASSEHRPTEQSPLAASTNGFAASGATDRERSAASSEHSPTEQLSLTASTDGSTASGATDRERSAASSEHKPTEQPPLAASTNGSASTEATEGERSAASSEHRPSEQSPLTASTNGSAASGATDRERSSVSPFIPSTSDQAQAEAYIALGSNMGDREANLMSAIEALDAEPGIRVTGVSGIYETDPVGYTDQPAFLNMAVAVRTELAPLELLRTQLRLESGLGRIRQVRWGPRTIDLDLLLYDNVRMDQEELTLPHPRMMERAFVLVPLHDVISSSHPLHEQVATTSAHALQAGKDGITLWKTINWRSASEPSGS